MLNNYTNICKFYRTKQGCRFKERCRYRHSDSTESTLVLTNPRPESTSESNNLVETIQIVADPQTPCNNNEAVNQASESPQCEFRSEKPIYNIYITEENFEEQVFANINYSTNSHSSNTNHDEPDKSTKPVQGQDKQICHFFARRGWCAYRKRCKFAHVKGKRLRPNKGDDDRVSKEGGGVSSEDTVSKDVDDSGASEDGGTVSASTCDVERRIERSEESTYDPSTVASGGQEERSDSGSQLVGTVCDDPDGKTGEVVESSHGDCKVQVKQQSVASECAESDKISSNASSQEYAAGTSLCHSSKTSAPVREIPVCQYFAYGYCRFGRYCRFSHIRGSKPRYKTGVNGCHNQTTRGSTHGDISNKQVQGVTVQPDTNSAIKETSKDGEHSDDNDDENDGDYTSNEQFKRRAGLREEERHSLRLTECVQLKRRLQTHKFELIEEGPDVSVYKFEFVPTDPDWPFDIAHFAMMVTIPATYPIEMFSVRLLEDSRVPEPVRSHMEECIKDHLTSRQAQLVTDDKIELVFRPFLRWLDRNLEDIVTDGLREFKRYLEAKAAGFEFILPKTTEIAARILNTYDDKKPLTRDDSELTHETGRDSDGSSGDDPDCDDSARGNITNERRGTEVLLRNLQFMSGVATLAVDRLCAVVQCDRCRNKNQVVTPPARLNELVCVKCDTTQRVLYRAALCHQFSSVIGYLDVDNCTVFEVILQECEVTLACDGCSRDMTSQTMFTGQVKETWCRVCHTKMRVATDAVRLTSLTQSTLISNQTIHKIVLTKQKRVLKDPAIQEGKPLPDTGTCKHYKKSYRWFRFPCCGRCYPCDVCHDEAVAGEHETRLANRVVCGHCANEQPYAGLRPCTMCHSAMTKSRSAFWEGGRGCRDKIAMSRTDSHKYKDSKKTTSNRSKAISDHNKKTTKLRHT